MEMKIEKIIKTLLWFEDYNEDTYCGGDRMQDEYGDWFYKVTEEDFEAFRQAADTMRKYQKIEDIYYHQSGMALENSLKEVIEHGNVD